MAKTVLITGASRGIGAATARRFAQAGYQVVVNYYKSEEKALALCEELGECAFPFRCDVSDPAQVEAMVNAAMERFGRIDALVCNAGVEQLPAGLAQDISIEEWNRVFSVNVNGVFYAVRSVLPHMVRAQYGRIITISSMWGQVGGACESCYSATKGAVIAFGKALAKEVGLSHITVNSIAPGVINTDMMSHVDAETTAWLADEAALGRIGQPEEIASAACFLASDEAAFITGQVLGVNGGFVI